LEGKVVSVVGVYINVEFRRRGRQDWTAGGRSNAVEADVEIRSGDRPESAVKNYRPLT
jgi:hypothetical protein